MSDEPTDRIGFQLQRVHNRVRGAILAALEGSDLNPGQLAILGVLAAKPGQTQRDLIAATGIEKSSMVIFLDRLEAQGWIARRAHPTDRRAHAVHLTPAGLERLAVIGPRLQAAEAQALSALDEAEKAHLLRLLQRLSG
ncbi:MAG TPA: MarR family transcriptional regulator [Phenylobacterium sp.]|jgi:DNA-binding MarR family transcriptional regulator|nr:MarR family transcriptional regulator [Phenylobacterium sp.]